ncbi:aldehyde dehydrogenase [Colletotrichum cuscutae]|uniref:Aldehyde dehydrogenase n=1 Tax=Colletotrichum cuscutae TaxID=1209917 RepID=A0AAI9Y434_9PEZI|nr:aldehyde dehydrogenase [Colletotrichum cuscutae]
MDTFGSSLKEAMSGSKSEFPWSKTNLPKQLYINNQYVDSKNSKKLELFNPNVGSEVQFDRGIQSIDAGAN